jgi:nitrite reductase/ring-hydroxylating ferredoxin subunit
MAKKIVFGDPIAGDGVEVILCRVGGELCALDALCPHEGGRISEGPLAEGRYAVCPLHSYWFDPSSGECANATCRKAKTYRVRAAGEDCEIWL